MEQLPDGGFLLDRRRNSTRLPEHVIETESGEEDDGENRSQIVPVHRFLVPRRSDRGESTENEYDYALRLTRPVSLSEDRDDRRKDESDDQRE